MPWLVQSMSSTLKCDRTVCWAVCRHTKPMQVYACTRVGSREESLAKVGTCTCAKKMSSYTKEGEI